MSFLQLVDTALIAARNTSSADGMGAITLDLAAATWFAREGALFTDAICRWVAAFRWRWHY